MLTDGCIKHYHLQNVNKWMHKHYHLQNVNKWMYKHYHLQKGNKWMYKMTKTFGQGRESLLPSSGRMTAIID